MCGLARFVTSLASSAAQTASTQWLERTLDDSVNRRLTLPQGFLATDAVLRLAINVAGGLEVFPHIVRRNVLDVLPYMATENLLMAAVTAGADRQEGHERIRQYSRQVTRALREGSGENNLLDLLRKDPLFSRVSFEDILVPEEFVGRAPEQVEEFIREQVDPVRKRHPQATNQTARIAL
jgi:adenylosuccinate lyase